MIISFNWDFMIDLALEDRDEGQLSGLYLLVIARFRRAAETAWLHRLV